VVNGYGHTDAARQEMVVVSLLASGLQCPVPSLTPTSAWVFSPHSVSGVGAGLGRPGFGDGGVWAGRRVYPDV